MTLRYCDGCADRVEAAYPSGNDASLERVLGWMR